MLRGGGAVETQPPPLEGTERGGGIAASLIRGAAGGAAGGETCASCAACAACAGCAVATKPTEATGAAAAGASFTSCRDDSRGDTRFGEMRWAPILWPAS